MQPEVGGVYLTRKGYIAVIEGDKRVTPNKDFVWMDSFPFWGRSNQEELFVETWNDEGRVLLHSSHYLDLIQRIA